MQFSSTWTCFDKIHDTIIQYSRHTYFPIIHDFTSTCRLKGVFFDSLSIEIEKVKDISLLLPNAVARCGTSSGMKIIPPPRRILICRWKHPRILNGYGSLDPAVCCFFGETDGQKMDVFFTSPEVFQQQEKTLRKDKFGTLLSCLVSYIFSGAMLNFGDVWVYRSSSFAEDFIRFWIRSLSWVQQSRYSRGIISCCLRNTLNWKTPG